MLSARVTIRPSLSVEYIPGPNSTAHGYRFEIEPVLTDKAIPLSARICFWIAGVLRRLAR